METESPPSGPSSPFPLPPNPRPPPVRRLGTRGRRGCGGVTRGLDFWVWEEEKTESLNSWILREEGTGNLKGWGLGMGTPWSQESLACPRMTDSKFSILCGSYGIGARQVFWVVRWGLTRDDVEA